MKKTRFFNYRELDLEGDLVGYLIPKALIGRTVTDPSPNRPRTVMVYEHFSSKADCIATSNRADAVLLARLRAGHTPLLKAYAHLLYQAADPTCPLCKEELQTLEHWLQRCPNLDGLRQHTFGSPHDRPREGANARLGHFLEP